MCSCCLVCFVGIVLFVRRAQWKLSTSDFCSLCDLWGHQGLSLVSHFILIQTKPVVLPTLNPWMLRKEAINTNFIVYGLTRLGIKPRPWLTYLWLVLQLPKQEFCNENDRNDTILSLQYHAIIIGNVEVLLFGVWSVTEVKCRVKSRAPDKMLNFNLHWQHSIYLSTKSYFWPLVKIVSQRRV